MGFVACIIKSLFKVSVYTGIVFLVISLAPGIPPLINFDSYTLTPAQVIAPMNTVLDKAEVFRLNREITGPESIAVKDGYLYTGIAGGEIVKISKTGEVSTVVKTGQQQCRGYWDTKCGRPLGMRFDQQGKLIVADGLRGLLKVDVDTGKVETLASIGGIIDGKKVMFPDDLDIDKEGNIYWSDVSANADMHSMVVEMLGEPSGRLLKYDPTKKKSEVLLTGIHFANGVQLSKNQDFVVVCETSRARILRYFIKGPNKGKYEIFVDGLAGAPDNVRPNGRGGYYVSLFMARFPYANPTENVMDMLSSWPTLRKLILRTQHILVWTVNLVATFTGPGDLLEELKFNIYNFGMTPERILFLPKRTVIAEINEHGEIIGNALNVNTEILAISEVNVGPEVTYFGSAMTKQIWKMRTTDLHKSVK